MTAAFADSTTAPDALRLRLILEQTIERALDLLDQLDGDPDLEPSLASQEARPDDCQATILAREYWPWPGAVDLEHEDEREPEDAI